MNRKKFEDAKNKIVLLYNEQNRFNGTSLAVSQSLYEDLPDDVADKVRTFGNSLMDLKIIDAARELLEAVEGVEADNQDLLLKQVNYVKDIHFRKNGTVEIKYDDGTIGKVETVYGFKEDDND